MGRRYAKKHPKPDPVAQLVKIHEAQSTANQRKAEREALEARKLRRHVLELIRQKDKTWKAYKELYSLRTRTPGQDEEMAQLRNVLDKLITELGTYGVR